MQIIGVSNIKGGVGKTTTTVNLAFLAASAGRRTVLWDLDPQGASTYLLGGETDERASARKLVRGRRELRKILAPTRRLMMMARTLQDDCDLLLLDCPPGISLLSENVLRAADAIVVPMLPAPLSLRMLEQLQGFVAAEGWSDLVILPFFSMVDRRRSPHEQLIAEARDRFPSILSCEVPYWSEIERMSVRRAPLPAFAPRSPAAEVYAALWKEIEARLRP